MNLHIILYVVRFGIRIRDRTIHIILKIGKLDHQIKGLENLKFDLYGIATYSSIKTLLRLFRRLDL